MANLYDLSKRSRIERQERKQEAQRKRSEEDRIYRDLIELEATLVKLKEKYG